MFAYEIAKLLADLDPATVGPGAAYAAQQLALSIFTGYCERRVVKPAVLMVGCGANRPEFLVVNTVGLTLLNLGRYPIYFCVSSTQGSSRAISFNWEG